MKTLSLAKARLSDLVDQVNRRDGKIVITKNGRPAAVLVSVDEHDSWQGDPRCALGRRLDARDQVWVARAQGTQAQVLYASRTSQVIEYQYWKV